MPASAFGGLQPGTTPRQPGRLLRASRLPAAMLLALAAACSAGDATAPSPDATPPAPRDASARDRDPVLPDAEARDLRPVDERAPIADAGSADTPNAPDASPSAEAGSSCTRPPADQPWIRAYQDDLVARLAGARALPAGGMLGVRASAGSRTATRQFLVDQFKDIGLTAQLHNYGSGQNVQAELKATAGANEYVVFGAHFDTVAGSPGANDNATGVAAVLSAARYLQLLPCRSRHVLFVLFDEEEDGLVGSAAFARKLKADGVRVHSVHTIDQMGWDMDGDQRIEVELPDRGLRELYLAAATDLGWTNPAAAIVTSNVSSTDHASFRPDFPAIGLTEEYRSGDTTPHYHKPSDTYATVNLDYLKHTTVLVHHVFADLLSPTPLFADRLPRPQVILRKPTEIDFKARLQAGAQPRL